MKKLKKVFGWLSVVLVILSVACLVAPGLIANIQANEPDKIVPGLLEVIMPGGQFGGKVLFNFAEIFAFGDLVTSILAILGLVALLCVAINFLAWLILAIVMKRPGQIWVDILFTIVMALEVYLVAMNTIDIVATFTNVMAVVQSSKDLMEMLGAILPAAGLLIGYLALLFAFAAFVFNVLFLIFNRKAVILRKEREKRELYSRHKGFIKEFRVKVEEAEKTFNELKEFVATDKGHALYLRPDLKEAAKNLKNAKKALKKAESKYKAEKKHRKPLSVKDAAYAKKLAERDARRAEKEKKVAAERAKALEERKAREAAAKKARAKAEKEAAARRAVELEARKAREEKALKERKAREAAAKRAREKAEKEAAARRAVELEARKAREAAAKKAREKAEKEAAERRAKVLEERKVREEIARKQAELRRAKALEERKLREEIAKKQAEIRRAKALEERQAREEAAKKAHAKALREKEEKRKQEAELRAAIKKVEEEFRAKHSVEVKVAPVEKAPAKKAHKKAHKKAVAKPVVKAPAKKPVARKAPVKKAPIKKPVAKKAPVKKVPAKKPVAKKVVAPVAKAKVAAPAVKMTFAKRIAGADKALKDAYNEIKSEIMSYGVNSRVASAGDTFRLHTKTYVKMVVAGKSLKLYMALNPKDYANSPMPIGDASKKNLYKEIPLVFKVKSDLSLRRAKMLIADTMAKDNLVQGPVEKRDWIKEL